MPLMQKDRGVFEKSGRKYRVNVFVEQEVPAIYRVVGERLDAHGEVDHLLYDALRATSESHAFVETDPYIRAIIAEARLATVTLDR